jgi:ring-1,2-phenylacetyl-CoA epoxidase subunit PaaB
MSAPASTPNSPLWEVFVRPSRGTNHVHVGSLHATDSTLALQNARDLYTRRGEGVSIWVVLSSNVVASSPDEKDAFFAPAADKVYRHPTFYAIPDGVEHL